MPSNYLDLSAFREQLEEIFQLYPAGNYCDVCAKAVGVELKKAGFEVAIVTIMNEVNPGQPDFRPSFIHTKTPDGNVFVLGQNGFHQANRIAVGGEAFYVDPLVYLHHGVIGVTEQDYFNLFLYADGVEITEVSEV